VDRCVVNALALAGEHKFSSVAIPLIGSGTGGLSAAAAKSCILEAIDRSDYQGEVIIVEFSGRK
jgi:O-acetyl-ADP-ribose deacetylase (regulator of RNase III)